MSARITEIGRPGYRTDDIRHLTPGNATRHTPPDPKGALYSMHADGIAVLLTYIFEIP